MSDKNTTVGFAGIGAMGMGMARSLLRAGFRVQAFDVNPTALETFFDDGGIAAHSPAQAAAGASVFIVMVLNNQQADSVLFGGQGAAAVLGAESVVMLCSTVQPSYARATAERLAALGIEMLDSPVSGGTGRAAEGTLSMMVSGSPTAFTRAESVLAALSERVFRMGDEPGLGSTMKLINQILAGVHLAAAAEALSFGARAGIDPERIFEVISECAGNSWMFQNRMPHVLADDYTPHSAVEIWVKDLDIVLQAGKENRFPLPLSAAAHQLFMMAAASGYGRLDDAAVVKVFEKLADFKVVKK